MKIPNRSEVPKSGYYYHYKHDPAGSVYNYAYFFLNAGIHTEDDCRPQDSAMTVYLPLYEDATVYQAGKYFDLRPLGMWTETATKDGQKVPRFRRITDEAVIAQLRTIRQQMYAELFGG